MRPVFRPILLFALGPLVAAAHAQVHVDRPIELTGAAPADRQITGLPAVQVADAALSAAQEQSGSHRHAAVEGQVLWTVAAPGLADMPGPGTQLLLTLSEPAAASAEVTVNGHGPYPVSVGPAGSGPLPPWPAGTTLALVFDGTGFQVLNGADRQPRPCPDGTVAVDDMFCLAPDEHPDGPTDMFTAILACHDQGLRLCTWGEWITACHLRETLGINTMFGNWEWTDDMANEDVSARLVGISASIGCASAGVGHALNSARHFRCCYTR
jgi:hypothetical protein